MMDFVPTTGAVKHKRKESGSLDMAFVETRDQENPTCYACGKQHPRGYRFCCKVTKEVQDQTIKAVDAGYFQ